MDGSGKRESIYELGCELSGYLLEGLIDSVIRV